MLQKPDKGKQTDKLTDRQTDKLTDRQTDKQTDKEAGLDLLSYQDIADKLEESITMVGPTWPSISKHPALLAKKQSKEMVKQLRKNYALFGKLPPEREFIVKKNADKQAKSAQIYNLYNNFAPLQYFL